MAGRKLAGKRVIITGASSGIGEQLARQLAEKQCRVMLNARRSDRLEKLAEEIAGGGRDVHWVAGDITDANTRARLIEAAQDHYSGLDILINNAGIGAVGAFAQASEARLRRVMEVNFFAVAELTRQAIGLLKNGNQPLIVNLSSVLAHRAVPLKSEYCSSKFALHGWSDSLRAELTKDNIDVLLVSPSTTDSEFFDSVIENTTGKNLKLSSAQSPQYVARRAIEAMQRGKHEMILSWSGWWLVWLDRLLPSLADKIVARYGQ